MGWRIWFGKTYIYIYFFVRLVFFSARALYIFAIFFSFFFSLSFLTSSTFEKNKVTILCSYISYIHSLHQYKLHLSDAPFPPYRPPKQKPRNTPWVGDQSQILLLLKCMQLLCVCIIHTDTLHTQYYIVCNQLCMYCTYFKSSANRIRGGGICQTSYLKRIIIPFPPRYVQ